MSLAKMFLYLKVINEIETFVFERNAQGQKTLIERIFCVRFALFVFSFTRKRRNKKLDKTIEFLSGNFKILKFARRD